MGLIGSSAPSRTVANRGIASGQSIVQREPHASGSRGRFRITSTVARRHPVVNVEGSGCRPSRTLPHAQGPASGSLQGRNPQEARHCRCRSLYGDCGRAQRGVWDARAAAWTDRTVRQRGRRRSERPDNGAEVIGSQGGVPSGCRPSAPVENQRVTVAVRRTAMMALTTYRS